MGRYSEDASAFGFEDLEVYQAAAELRRRFCKLVKLLPDEERFALAQQMRRAAASVTNNIAEGYGRHHRQENIQFCRLARGSLMELVDDLNICADQGYAKAEHLADLKEDAAKVVRLLNGYIAYLKQKKDKESI